MVRPNQIIASDLEANTLTFIMFGRSPQQVGRRVLLLNFPGKGVKAILNGQADRIIESVKLISSGMVNRYAVTLNIGEL